MSHAYRTVRHGMLLALLLFATASQGLAQWLNAPVLPQNRTAGMPASVGGKLYMFGGSPELEIDPFSIPTGATNTAWVLNQGGSSWSQLAVMPDARSGGYAGAVNGKIYILGGSRITNQQVIFATNVLEYDPATNKYTSKAAMPVPLTAMGGAVVGSKIYLFGGATVANSRLTISNTALAYDVVSNTWTTLPAAPYAAVWPAAGSVNNDIFLVGGVTGNGQTREVYKGGVVSGDITWTRIADYPMPIGQASVGALGAKLYASGGRNAEGYQKKTFQLNVANNTWVASYALPVPTAIAGPLTYDGTSLYFIGGSQLNNVYKLSEGPAVPIADVAPLKHFVTAKTGTSQDITITISNDGIAPLSGAFVIPPTAATWLSTTNTSVSNIAGGAKTTVTFKVGGPAVAQGNYTATVQFQNNDAAHNDIPIVINLYARDEIVQQPTTVVLEEGTGTWCGWCPYAHRIADEIEAEKGDQFIQLAYHGPNGSADPWTSPTIDGLLDRLGLGGYPNGAIQRWLFPGEASQMVDRTAFAPYVDAVLAAQPNAPVALEVVEYKYDAATKRVTAKLKITGSQAVPMSDGINIKVNAIVVESGLIHTQTEYGTPQGTVEHPDYDHKRVVRTVWPNADGQTVNIPTESIVDGVLLPGASSTFDVSFTTSVDDAAQSATVFFVHLTSGSVLGPILQGTEVPLTASIGGGGGTTSFGINTATLTKTVGSGDTASFTTVVTNTGTNPVTVTISRTGNSLPESSWKSWFCEGTNCTDPTENGMAPLTIAPGQTSTITVKVLAATAGTGTVTLRYGGNNGVNNDQIYTVNSSDESSVDEPVTGSNGLLLSANVPNPASSITSFRYTVPAAGTVTFEVYNLAGQKVLGMDAGRVEAGAHSFDMNVASLPAGMYSVRLTAAGRSVSRMLTVTR